MDTWMCHICYRERPDDKISVLSKPLALEGRLLGTQNIRYCNDSEECIKKAQDFSFFRSDEEVIHEATQS